MPHDVGMAYGHGVCTGRHPRQVAAGPKGRKWVPVGSPKGRKWVAGGGASPLGTSETPGRLLPAAVGLAPRGEALVLDDAAGEVHQDRGEGCVRCPVRGLSDGGGGNSGWAVPGDPGTDPSAMPVGSGAGMTSIGTEAVGDSAGRRRGFAPGDSEARLDADNRKSPAQPGPDGCSWPGKGLVDAQSESTITVRGPRRSRTKVHSANVRAQGEPR